jgi:hypothetical protein
LKGEQVKVFKVLGSSVFRRNIRLWGIHHFGTAISALLAFDSLCTPIPTRGELILPVSQDGRSQMRHWYGELSKFVFPWKGLDVNGNGVVGFV